MNSYIDKKQQLKNLHKEAAKLFYASLRLKEGVKGMKYFTKRKLSDEILKDFGLGFSSKSGTDLYTYFKSKGFDDEIIKESGIISYNDETGWKNKFWGRVIFPIINISGDVVGFGGRVLDDSKPKYLNSPETLIFDKSSNLYALNKAIHSQRPYFILCEGYMDVISLHQAGFDCAIAALGTAYTKNHAAIIKRYTDNVYLTFDSDMPGINAALRAIPICRQAGLKCKIINMSPYKDPDEFIKNLGCEEFEKRIEEAENDFLFEARISRERCNFDNIDEKIEYYKNITSKLCNLNENEINDILKDNYQKFDIKF